MFRLTLVKALLLPAGLPSVRMNLPGATPAQFDLEIENTVRTERRRFISTGRCTLLPLPKVFSPSLNDEARMPSLLAWIDHDPAEQERMQQVLSLFQVRDTRDELGLGAIRDSFADQLFPGTSTIQTRLRYMLFVPWIYQSVERDRIPSAMAATVARKGELALADVLTQEGDWGTFGKTAGQSLKRLPSSVYWAGLEAWGIRRFSGSQEQYHRVLDEVYRQRSMQLRRDDGEGGWEGSLETWHPKLPAAPEGFPSGMDFRLTATEADFIRERIAITHPDSLLAYLVVHAGPADAAFPWMHPDRASFPEQSLELLHHARLFSDVMNGAAILYNLMLAELAEHELFVEQHRTRFADWLDSLDHAAIRAWDLDQLWFLAGGTSHTITYRARTFVSEWAGVVRADPTDGLARRNEARTLVQRREMLLKGGRSRFTNRAVLGQWSGSAGIERMNYRWATVRGYLDDLAAAHPGDDHA
jgi:hypothetical protein